MAKYTLAALFDAFLFEQVENRKNKASSVEEMTRIFKRNILGYFGIKTDVESLLLPTGKSVFAEHPVKLWHALGKSAPYVANRALGYLSDAIGVAEDLGWIDRGRNPCPKVGRYKEEGREQYPDDGELDRLIAAMTWLHKEHMMTGSSFDALRVIVLTGARRNEILRLAWEPDVPGSSGWVDMTVGILRLRDTKRGKKEIPLDVQAIEIFEERHELEDERSWPWVFGGHRIGRPLAGLQRAYERTCQFAEVRGICIHSLRHSFATRGLDAGIEVKVMQGLLGHKDVRSTMRYQHASTDTMRKALRELNKGRATRLSVTPPTPKTPKTPKAPKTPPAPKAPETREVPDHIN